MLRTLLATVLLLGALPASAALRVFACEPEWGALARAVGGEQVEVYVATGPHQDPHHVEAKPSLVAQVRRADLVVCNGAELEIGWLPMLIARSANPQLKGERVFYAADHVALLDVITGPVDRSHGDVHAAGNPHIHLDPRRLLAVGDALARTLGRIDAAHAAQYGQRAQALRASLEKEMAGWNTAALQGRRWFVYHDAWPYLFDWLGAVEAGTVEPRPGIPPSSAHLAALAKRAKAGEAAALLHSTYDDGRAITWLRQQGGVCTIALPYTVDTTAGGPELVAWYREIVRRLLAGC